ncbi:siderophore synthetase component [Stackebrandtia albiflava]|uniref:Siderophore synthetase component n=1 Tax=Stackebrandtia albiflava TaxID=406432 RepID=A0A562VDB7_9ACTN|nr:IucA/IucC family protein [Stackebrandtia albiflava]TWJ15862.1 siderophore synthetase component [Stackebrandtia albiflava]
MNHHAAAHHLVHAVLAAAWREDLAHIRTRAHRHGDTHTTPTGTGTLRFHAHTHAFAQITPHGTVHHDDHPVTDPATLLRLLEPGADITELTDAVEGLALALTRHRHITDHHRALARTHHAHDSVTLAHRLATGPRYQPCRHFEPLAVTGHHLHPGARTRLGWTHTDRLNHDLESHHTTRLPVISASRELVTTTGQPLDHLLTTLHPPLRAHLHPDRVLIPLHPWQHRHVVTTRHHDLYRRGLIHDLPDIHIPAEPTASIRTLVLPDGHYLKTSLDIHITSTRRGISPATAANGPALSHTLHTITTTDPHLRERLTVLPEPAAVSAHHTHPAARDLTCILRGPLHHHTRPGELAVPATALPATSPHTGTTIATELAAHHPGTPQDFLTRYATILLGTTLHLAAHYGIGLEAHLQNCIPVFRHATPVRVILRDLGGARIHTPRLTAAGHTPRLHPHSVTTTDDITVTHTKVAYTVIQNHLAALVNALHHDGTLHATDAWKTIGEIIADTDIPTTDRDFYTTPTLPLKALLHMRLHNGPDHHVPVPNPLAT